MLSDVDVLKHYLREDVEAELARFCKGRWVAVECTARRGRRIFHRYLDREKPITISEPADLKKILNKLGKRRPRTIYASANIYRKLESKEDLSREENIEYATPSWDVDGSLDEVDLIKEAAEVLIDELRRNEVEKSVYLIWSGRGIHVHLNEKAISEEIWRKGALKVSYSVVEYVLRSAKPRLMKICEKSRATDRKLKIENIMDIQRVFTAPLSLHRELDIVAVTINPDELDEFNLSWTDPKNFRYWKSWDRFEPGEADELAEKALEAIKGEERIKIAVEEPSVKTKPTYAGRVGRFQVMALLQAARYYALKNDLNLAKSFGLNRAIFYAWAKKRGITTRRGRGAGRAAAAAEAMAEEHIGDEVAFRSRNGWFAIGGQVQKPVDFDRQVAARFGPYFEKYWKSAVEYVKRFPREVLESQRDFYQKVYLPVRDDPRKILESKEKREERA